MIKAPAGGLVSRVNGQFYEGGEFMPDHGKCCGKGKNAVTRADFDDVNRRAALRGWELIFSEKFGDFRLIQTGRLAGQVMFRAASLKTLAKLV
jgi:hypothetical protein